MTPNFEALSSQFSGELYFDNSTKHLAIKQIYATDASVYQEMPLAVAIPKTVEDIQTLVKFAVDNNKTLVPRAAGTSLAGQVVSHGIIIDISKYFTQILELNVQEKWVRVQPGVIRDDLNAYLKPFGLMFGPETSTANRAMIGGMIGNNSSGLHSIIWGDTRSNLLELKVLLRDGTEQIIKNTSLNELKNTNTLLSTIEKSVLQLLNKPDNQAIIKEHFPKKTVTRRNTGYAIDALLKGIEEQNSLNLCSLLAGSEGTLAITTEAKLKLIDLPPAEVGVVAVHCNSIHESLLVNLVAMQHHCDASELVDDFIINETHKVPSYADKRFFIKGTPKAILIVEFFDKSKENLQAKCEDLIADLQKQNLGYAYPILFDADAVRVWDVRKAGLGLLRNLKGDTQPVNLIEDCAVAVEDLPHYIEDLEQLLMGKNVQYSMYAHAGAGELHVEPLINLKTSAGQRLFREVLAETAQLVIKYKGSLSGEHGDGRLRGEFIATIMGEEAYQLFKDIKAIFDPQGIFNKGKIVDTPSMLANLRYEADAKINLPETFLNFSEQENILRLAEKCSGSGDCRKTVVTGGTMCPSYMATRSERDTTRARANILRQYFTPPPLKGSFTGLPTANVVGDEAKEILDLCLSCKACKSECPSGVDIAKLRAEFLYQYQEKNGYSFRSKLIGNFSKQMKLAAIFPPAYNFIVEIPFLRRTFNKIVGFHPDRTLPALNLLKANQKSQEPKAKSQKPIYFFLDEFTKYNDGEVGKKAILLLQKLGYEVIIPKHVDSGRSYLSKGMLKEAKELAIQNVSLLKTLINENTPLLGVEPSAILSFRDEYIDLVPENLREDAKRLAQNTFILEEWLGQDTQLKKIDKSIFTDKKRLIKLHGHCHQKAMSSLVPVKKLLSLPKNYEVQLIPSGCCGMAGSFGYEAEHYELSMKVGELVLFPTIREQNQDTIIAAAGTSCRHQIKDGTSRKAKHPVEVLYEAIV